MKAAVDHEQERHWPWYRRNNQQIEEKSAPRKEIRRRSFAQHLRRSHREVRATSRDDPSKCSGSETRPPAKSIKMTGSSRDK